MLTHLVLGMAFGEIIRVLSLGKQHYIHVHPLLQHKPDTPEGGLDARTVTVIYYGDIVRELADKPYLLDRKRSSARSHDIRYAELVH